MNATVKEGVILGAQLMGLILAGILVGIWLWPIIHAYMLGDFTQRPDLATVVVVAILATIGIKRGMEKA